jgi:hypothetical protein
LYVLLSKTGLWCGLIWLVDAMAIALEFAYSSDRFFGRVSMVALAESRTIYVDTTLAAGIDVRKLVRRDSGEGLA